MTSYTPARGTEHLSDRAVWDEISIAQKRLGAVSTVRAAWLCSDRFCSITVEKMPNIEYARGKSMKCISRGLGFDKFG
jgi:hypothetical protein